MASDDATDEAIVLAVASVEPPREIHRPPWVRATSLVEIGAMSARPDFQRVAELTRERDEAVREREAMAVEMAIAHQERDEARAVLRECEWICQRDDEERSCPICQRYQFSTARDGKPSHDAGCRLAAAVKEG